MLLLIAGILMGVGTLSFIHQVGTNGLVCYIVGSIETARDCLHPSLYYGLLGVAAVLIVLGLAQLIKNGTAARR